MATRLENALDIALKRALDAVDDLLRQQREAKRLVETASRLMERLYPVDPNDPDFIAGAEAHCHDQAH